MVFVTREKDEVDQLFNVGVMMGKKKIHPGKVGLEIECEGNKFKKMDLPKPWIYYQDHSLRGQDNAEYILDGPIQFDEVPGAIHALWDMMKKYGTKLDDSNRTSVHVHLNVQDFHLNRLTSFMGLWFIVEEPLTEFCGDHRVGNLFCLRGKDAPAIITQVRQFITTNMQWKLQDYLHYSGMNIHALAKLGSLEFRTLKGETDPQRIIDWVRILQRLYELSAEFPDPREVCGLFSSLGAVGFFDAILGDMAGTVRKTINWTDSQISEAMLEGVRLSQDICFARDWSIFKGIEFTPDPFGRSPTKMLKRMQSLGNLQVQNELAALEAEIYGDDDDEMYLDEGPAYIPTPPPPHPNSPQAINTLGVWQAVTQVVTQQSENFPSTPPPEDFF